MNLPEEIPKSPTVALPAAPRPGDVHAWAVPRADPPVAVEELEALLAPAELARTRRFHFEADRVRAVVGRGVLRLVLARCTGIAPRALELTVAEHGKPVLLDDAGRGLDFNVSHSGDWILVAVARNGRVGVDVEQQRELTDLDALVQRFFAPGEARALRSLNRERRETAFFECWTRKEAYIKALGSGLQTALDRFEVEVRPGRPAALLRVDGSPRGAAGWRLWSAWLAPGHAAAVASEAPGRLHAWTWSGTRGLVVLPFATSVSAGET